MVGEHIRALKGGRWIHAIDCGDETVLHLAEDATPPRVRRAYRPEFVAGAQSVENVTHRERTFPPAEVVRRAYSRASDPTLAAMFGDSLAFAEWCTTGRPGGARNAAVVVTGPPVAGDQPPARPTTSPKRAREKQTARGPRAAKGASPKRASAKTAGRKTARKRGARAGKPAPRGKVSKRPGRKPARRRRER
jgi:hypothetical protein